MATHYIKQGATLPKLSAQFTDATGVASAIPNGAVVLFRARSRSAAPGVYKINAAALVENATTGLVSYTFETTDTNTPGLMICEFVVTFGATVQKIPTIGFDFVMVTTGL